MAGSYMHCVTDEGLLRPPSLLAGSLENGGDVWEAVHELYGMVWYLADGDAEKVAEAQRSYLDGIALSPGVSPALVPAPRPGAAAAPRRLL